MLFVCVCLKLKKLKVQDNLCDVCTLFYKYVVVVYANFGKHQIILSILTRVIIFTKYNKNWKMHYFQSEEVIQTHCYVQSYMLPTWACLIKVDFCWVVRLQTQCWQWSFGQTRRWSTWGQQEEQSSEHRLMFVPSILTAANTTMKLLAN